LAIAYWWQDENTSEDVGRLHTKAHLHAFDETVRGELVKSLKAKFGHKGTVPYVFAVLASIPSALNKIDHQNASRNPKLLRVLATLDILFLREPMNIALIIIAMRLYGGKARRAVGKRLAQLLAGVVSLILYRFTRGMAGLAFKEAQTCDNEESSAFQFSPAPVVWVAFEFACVIFLYKFGHRIGVETEQLAPVLARVDQLRRTMMPASKSFAVNSSEVELQTPHSVELELQTPRLVEPTRVQSTRLIDDSS